MTGKSGNWGDLRDRAISGVGMAALALICLYSGGMAWSFLLFMVGIGLAMEWGKLTAGSIDSGGTALLAASIGIAVIAFAVQCPQAGVAALAFGFVALLAWARKPLLAAGVPCIGAAVAALWWMRADPDVGFANVLFAVTVVCGSDIGAYMTGRAIGGRKLAPAISPGKTLSGAVGGLVCAGLAGVGIAAWWANAGNDGRIGQAALLAVLIGVVAQAGDLAESWLKRHVGAKDSSHLIPGHGGLLDRLDAVMAVAPVAAMLAFTLGRGVVLWK